MLSWFRNWFDHLKYRALQRLRYNNTPTNKTSIIGPRGQMIDYHHAAKRSYRDAELLMANTRPINAGHLYGFASECGIKSLLVAHGLPTNPTTGDIIENRPYNYRVHINKLVSTMPAFVSGRGGAKYLAMMPNINHFSNWRVEFRYYLDTAVPTNVNSWRSATIEVITMLDQAVLDGVIR